MLQNIVDNPELQNFIRDYGAGQTIFLEGEESQDLYILLSGELAILKGNKKIAELTGEGTVFGEMSFLLGAARTATAKAQTDLKAVRIPKEDVNTFLCDFPEMAQETTRILAKRLDETSQVVSGLKEICDQLPDAVLLTDREGMVLSFNTAARKLYGLEWEPGERGSVLEIYTNPEAYRNLVKQVEDDYTLNEQILAIKHPDGDEHFVSLSMTALYDGYHNFQGVISIGRDVTHSQQMKKRLTRIKYWVVPLAILAALVLGAGFYSYPYLVKGMETVDLPRREFKSQITRDVAWLKSLLADHFITKDTTRTSRLLSDFISVHKGTGSPYIGLVLLDKSKLAFDALSIKGSIDPKVMVGTSYSHLNFRGGNNSPHKVLTLYRKLPGDPASHKSLELAFEVNKDGRTLGWLIFQMDADVLKEDYGLDELDLVEMNLPAS